MMQTVHNGVEGGTRTHRRLHLGRIRVVIPTELHWLAFHRLQFLQNRVYFCFQFLRHRGKNSLQLLIVILRGQFLRPIQGFVDMATGIIQLAEHTAWGFAILHELASGPIQRVSENLRLFVARGATQMRKGFRQRHKFPERIPA